MTFDFGAFNNWGQLKKVAVRDVETAFASDDKIDAEWKDLNFHARPDLVNARASVPPNRASDFDSEDRTPTLDVRQAAALRLRHPVSQMNFIQRLPCTRTS